MDTATASTTTRRLSRRRSFVVILALMGSVSGLLVLCPYNVLAVQRRCAAPSAASAGWAAFLWSHRRGARIIRDSARHADDHLSLGPAALEVCERLLRLGE